MIKSPKHIKTTNTYVLVRIDHDNSSIKFGKNGELVVDPALDPAKHVPVYGTVACVPDRLLYGTDKTRRELTSNSMEWETDIEIKKGDTVYFVYLAMIMALGSYLQDKMDIHEQSKLFFEFEDDPAIYVLLLYSDLYFAIRNDNIIMLNGYVMVKHLDKQYEYSTLTRTEKMLEEKEKNTGLVVRTGSVCKRHYKSKKVDCVNISVGDIIIFRKFTNIYFESQLHSTFRDGANYFCIQRKYIYGVLN